MENLPRGARGGKRKSSSYDSGLGGKAPAVPNCAQRAPPLFSRPRPVWRAGYRAPIPCVPSTALALSLPHGPRSLSPLRPAPPAVLLLRADSSEYLHCAGGKLTLQRAFAAQRQPVGSARLSIGCGIGNPTGSCKNSLPTDQPCTVSRPRRTPAPAPVCPCPSVLCAEPALAATAALLPPRCA